MDEAERHLIDDFRDRVRKLAFTPMPTGRVAEARSGFEAGVENNRLEGLHASEGDRTFAAMLIEERVPVELWTRLGADYARALIAARDAQAAA